MPTVGGNDSPSGVGRGPEGMAWNIGLFSTFSSSRGSPNPALAQLTFDSTFLSSSEKIRYQSHLENCPFFGVNRYSCQKMGNHDNFTLPATGETRFSGGNKQSWHVGHVYPAGAVLEGSSLA